MTNEFEFYLTLKREGIRELAFFVSTQPDHAIMAHLTIFRKDWVTKRFKEHLWFFNFLKKDDSPMGVDAGNDLVTVVWMLPYSLRDFLIEKFKGWPNVILSHLITDKNIQLTSTTVDLIADGKRIGNL